MSPPPLLQLLYVSHLAVEVALTDVGRMVEITRVRNLNEGITGILLFDGTRFCQYVEGSGKAVDELMARIRKDPMHELVDVLWSRPANVARRFEGWRIGYLEIDDHGQIDRISEVQGEEALRRFEDVLPRVDFGLVTV
jgi:hypothetical protein